MFMPTINSQNIMVLRFRIVTIMRKSVKCRQLRELTSLGFIWQIVSYEAKINNLKANVNHSNHLLENHRTRVGIAIKG